MKEHLNIMQMRSWGGRAAPEGRMDGKVSPGLNSDGREKLTEWRADLKNACVQGGVSEKLRILL